MDLVINHGKPNPDFVYSKDHDAWILGIYGSGSSNVRVATKLGLTITQFDSLRSSNPEFNSVCEFGENIAQATLEDIALSGAKGEIKNFNNTILQFLLKSLYPETYNDKKSKDDDGGTLLEQLAAGSLTLVKQNE